MNAASQLKKAEAIGRRDYRAGKLRYQNPYSIDFELRDAWFRGYDG